MIIEKKGKLWWCFARTPNLLLYFFSDPWWSITSSNYSTVEISPTFAPCQMDGSQEKKKQWQSAVRPTLYNRSSAEVPCSAIVVFLSCNFLNHCLLFFAVYQQSHKGGISKVVSCKQKEYFAFLSTLLASQSQELILLSFTKPVFLPRKF